MPSNGITLIYFVNVIFELLIAKICGIIGISKADIFKFSGIERVKQNHKIPETVENLLGLQLNHFWINFNKFRVFFCFFTDTWTISFPERL